MNKFRFYYFGEHLEIYTNDGKFYYRSRTFGKWSDAIELDVQDKYKADKYWFSKYYWPSN